MSRRSDRDRLADIVTACEAITSYLARSTVDGDIVYDAIRPRLIEIGEAVKDLDPKLLAAEPDIPWSDIARMRDQLTHHYFDTAHSIVHATAANDVPRLAAAVERLLK
jgi:uncharacterized protein with HEPN domain